MKLEFHTARSHKMKNSKSCLILSTLLVVLSACAFEDEDWEAIDQQMMEGSRLDQETADSAVAEPAYFDENADKAVEKGPIVPNAGGGCQGWYWPDGFRVRPCISASGSYAYGDAYVDAVPLGSCFFSIRMTVWKRDGGWHQPIATSSYGCSTGHIGPIGVYMAPGSAYFTEVCMNTSPGYTDCSRSPEVWR